MKKALKIFGGVIAALAGLLLISPILLKDKAKDIAVVTINDMLNAEVYLDDVSISFFKNFPNASVTAEKFGIIGKDHFAGDTLANVGELTVVVNVSSLLSESYQINKVQLKDAYLNAIVDTLGRANWDIMVSDSTEVAEEDTSSSNIKLALEKITVENLNVKYNDMPSRMVANIEKADINMKGDLDLSLSTLANIDELSLNVGKVAYADSSNLGANVENFNMTMNGKVSDAVSKIKSALGIEKVTVRQSGVPYLSEANIKADVNVEADLENNKYTFGQNNISLNEISASFDGFVQLVDTIIDMDVKLSTPNIEFKHILSLIPAMYKEDFQSIQTSGKVNLSAEAKGKMYGDILPSFNVDLGISEAMFKYPDLPSALKDINVAINAKNTQGTADNVTVDINKFGFNLAGNPFSVTAKLKKLISDPDFAFTAKGLIDLQKISEVVHIDDARLQGKLSADLDAAGLMSYVEKEQYDKFKVDGSLGLSDFILTQKGVDYNIEIGKANLDFTTQNVGLNADLKLGKSDISVNGKLTHFLQYVLRNEEIHGELGINSSYMNVNEIIGAPEEKELDEAPVAESEEPLVIPNNIDFKMNVGMNKIIYDKIEIDNFKGNISLKDAVAKLNSLSANTMGGSFTASGEFDGRDSLKPKAAADVNVSDMNLSEVFTKVRTAHRLVPLFSDASGKFSMSGKFSTAINGKDLSPIMPTINAKGTFKTANMGLTNVPAFTKVADKVGLAALKDPQFKDLNISFIITDGKLEIDPFETLVNHASVNVSGWSGLDRTLGYVAKIILPKEVPGKAGKIIDKIGFDVNVGGTFDKPEVKISTADMLANAKEKVTEKVTEKVEEAKAKVEEVKTKVNEAVEKQKAKMIADAESQRTKLIETAQKSGDKLVSEAEAQSAKLQSDAGNNPAKKAIAKKTGDGLVKKAKEQQAKLVQEATANGDKIVENAKAQAAKLDANNK